MKDILLTFTELLVNIIGSINLGHGVCSSYIHVHTFSYIVLS